MLITVNNFVGEIAIGQAENSVIAANIELFINKYEPMFLMKLLGKDLYNEFNDGLTLNPVPEKWNTLKNKVMYPCANYIYCYYMRNKASETNGFGETLPESENSQRVSPVQKIVRAWNEMVDINNAIKCELINNDAYPNYKYCCSDIFNKTNSFGI